MPRPISKADAKELRRSLNAIDADETEALRVVSLGDARRIIRIWERFAANKSTDQSDVKELVVPVGDKSSVEIYYSDLLFALAKVERYELLRNKRNKNPDE